MKVPGSVPEGIGDGRDPSEAFWSSWTSRMVPLEMIGNSRQYASRRYWVIFGA